MTNDPFYLIGRRASVNPASDSQSPVSLCAESGGNTGMLRTLGWSAATFGAGAILGWMASGRLASGRFAAGRMASGRRVSAESARS